ncbi:MAG: class I SAM-dependent methyltransferase [Planctomycetota bacterium]
MIEQLKYCLMKFRLARWVANLKNGTLSLLREGYRPRQFWDHWAEKFARQSYQRELHESNWWLLEQLREARATEVLEVGCGFGRNLKLLDEKLDGVQVLAGVDLSLELLRKARLEELSGQVLLSCGDATALPYHDEAFDCVVTHGMLMHVPPDAVRRGIDELVRVTRRTLWCIEEHVTAESARGKSFSINDYTFNHDYPELFREAGFPITRAERHGKVITLMLFRVDVGAIRHVEKTNQSTAD